MSEQASVPAVPGACDAAEFGHAATIGPDGACRCIVCARCGHHTGNAHQGHWWSSCKVLAERVSAGLAPGETLSAGKFLRRTQREFHFCCDDPAFGCELESAPLVAAGLDAAEQPGPLILPAAEFAVAKRVFAAMLPWAAVELAAGTGSDDASRALPVILEAPREHSGASPAIAPESLRELIGHALDTSVDPCARCKVCDRQIDAVMAVAWPLLEHAQDALTDNEGIRLWMLDCGELVAKHRERAGAAEAKLAEITDACRSIPTPIAERILAITGTGGDEGRD